MRCYTFSNVVLYYLTFGLPGGDSRKYDIEAESQKLYGEDLQAVLKRFRKTPEYVSILENKLENLNEMLDYIVKNIRNYYIAKINDKIDEIVGANNTNMDDVKRRFLRNRYLPFRRQSETTPTPSNMTGVERLDSYDLLHSALTVDERNSFKDVGFEFAGHIIHALINAATEDDGLHQITMLPYGSDEEKYKKHTTHHHQVTHVSTVGTEENLAPVDGYTHPPYDLS